ncbi:MAG: BTAD domain-containing putative transcriptional regulator [Acidimicrobiia bacterium]
MTADQPAVDEHATAAMVLPSSPQQRLARLRQGAHSACPGPEFLDLLATAETLDRIWRQRHADRLDCWHAYQDALVEEQRTLAELTTIVDALSSLGLSEPAQEASLTRVAPPTPRLPPLQLTPQQCDEPLLTVHLLGAFRLARSGHPVTGWAGTKAPRLVRYLFVNVGRPMPREELIELFWPDCDPANARRALHQTIYQIRRALRAAGDRTDRISFRHEIYRLQESAEIWSDLIEFERAASFGRAAAAAGRRDAALTQLAAAERCYIGAFLEDSLGEEWTHLERERLRLVYTDVGNRLAALLYESHRTEQALDIAHRVLRQDPCDESAHRRAMLCYARLGLRSSLVRQFRQCADTLKRELGVVPDERTVNLLHAELGVETEPL